MVALLNSDRLLDRLTQPIERDHGDRMEIIRGISHMVRDFPLLGTGLGTFSAIFPSYDRSNAPVFATHAENEYCAAPE